MTLVFRSPKLVEVISNQNPGPGAYKIKEGEQKNKHPSPAFISKVQRQNIQIEETNLGPFSYFKNETSTLSKAEGQQSMFKSKIQRFMNSEDVSKSFSKQKQFAQQFNELMKKEKNEHPYKGKLIDLKLKREKEEKLNDLQCLPSIPSHEHSYGYRVDYNTNKLVNNYNPKVIFTQNLKPNEKEDYYFQRSHKSLGNPKKCFINMNSKRAGNELTHQLSNPSLNTYNADRFYTIEEQAKKGKKNQLQTSLGRFNNQNSPSKKQLLKLNQIKRDFQMYIDNDHVDLNELQQSKRQQKQPDKSPSKKLEGSRPECFLTKQSRFDQKVQKLSASKIANKQPVKLLANSKARNSDHRDSSASEQAQKKKQPFDLGIERFQPRHKQSLGPGVYQLKEQTFKHGVNLQQNEERFKTRPNANQIPGPGSYEVNKDIDLRQKVRCPFSKHRNNEYFNEIKMHKAKEHSMEDLYQQVGKHMNYLNKIEKIDSRSKQNRQLGVKKSENNLNLDRISQAKKILKEKLSLGNEEILVEKENRSQDDVKSVKYEHLYGYNKPEEAASKLGPGCYEIATTLNKKTFNKTVKV